MLTILSAIADFVVSLIQTLLEVPIIWVGEIVLFLVSLGRHKPRWDTYLDSGGGEYAFLSQVSFWVGLTTICAIGGAVKLFIFKSPA